MQRLEVIWRVLFISALMVMSAANVLLDFLRHASISDLNTKVILATLMAALAAGLPAGALLLISALSKFKLASIEVYRLASDIVLSIGLALWFYLLFIRERPEHYEGASHMYVVFTPVLIGIFAIGLCLLCLLTQGAVWAIKHKHHEQ